jgi:hypothetical protein
MKKAFSTLVIGILILSSFGFFSVSADEEVSDEFDLLIIAPSAFSEELIPLIEHKNEYNVKTILKTTEEIYEEIEGKDNAEKIKYCIKKAKDESNITYVLLVGGRKNQLGLSEEWWVPVRYSHLIDRWGAMEKYSEESYISDLYFADIYDSQGQFSSWDTNENGLYGEWSGNISAKDICDLHPDVFLGRLACRNKYQVRICVKKIINYEKTKADDSWFKKMVVVGGDTYTSNDDYEGENYTQRALDNMPDFTGVKLWTSLGTFTGPLSLIREINKGCGFLFLSGHGSPGVWGTHPPKNDEELIYGFKQFTSYFLFNRNKLPVCILGSCHGSMFNVSLFLTTWNGRYPLFECLAWKLTRKVGGGAIATIGNTALGYGAIDKLDPSRGGGEYIEIFFFEEYGKNNSHVLGQAWGNAIERYLDRFPVDFSQGSNSDTCLDAKVVQEWVLLGDPSLKIGGY